MAVVARDLLPEWRLRESFAKHAARAQLHRLRAALRDDAPLDDLLASLADAADLAGAWRGRALPSLDALHIRFEGDHYMSAATADGTLSATFRRTDGVLPQLTGLRATGAALPDEPPGADRVRSTVHHFIGLVEHPARDPLPFRELLAGQFSLGYTATPTSDLAAFDLWVTQILASVVASEHVIHAIDVSDIDSGRMVAEVRMTSQALFPDGSGAISRNTQQWALCDTPGERFARIERIDIARDAVEFFGPAPRYEARQRPGT